MIGQRNAVLAKAVGPARTRSRTIERKPKPAQPAIRRLDLHVLVRQSVLAQLMVAMALISFAALIYLNQAGKVSVLQFRITQLQSEQIQLNVRNANLFASATSLQSLQRIENVATTQLHMSSPNLSNVIWVAPTVPRVAVPPPDPGVAAAQRASQPLAWMRHAIQFVGAQL